MRSLYCWSQFLLACVEAPLDALSSRVFHACVCVDIVALSCARHDPSFAAEVLEEIKDNEQQTSDTEIHVDIPRILATDTWTSTFEALAKAGGTTENRRVLDLLRALRLQNSRACSLLESNVQNSFRNSAVSWYPMWLASERCIWVSVCLSSNMQCVLTQLVWITKFVNATII